MWDNWYLFENLPHNEIPKCQKDPVFKAQKWQCYKTQNG